MVFCRWLPDRCGRGRAVPSASGAGTRRRGCPTGRARSVRRQRGRPARTPHPPSADPLARPRHRPGRRPLRLRPLPGAARYEAARRAVGPRRPRVLADDVSRQAVEALSLGLTAAFWWPGSAGGLTVSRPAAVPLRRQGRAGTLSVSHPTRTGEPQELEWGRPVRKVPDHPDAVEILPTGPRPRLRVTRGEVSATRV
ncbi:polysaccharide lyase beta-sandwich domain-containing protein [Streptomyces griseoincarnatus]